MTKRSLALLLLVAAPSLAQGQELPVYQATVEKPYVAAPSRTRWFSLGLGPTVLADTARDQPGPVMFGGNLRGRLRTRGRFGFEAAIGYLMSGGGKLSSSSTVPSDGATSGSEVATATPTLTPGPMLDVQRKMMPLSASALFYIFPNEDARVFNLLFLGGVGVLFDWVDSRDASGATSQLNLTSYEGHLGLGGEIRFRWFALEADVRALGILRGRDVSRPEPLLAPATVAVQTSINAVLWF